MAKTPKPSPEPQDGERLFRDHLLSRYVRVIQRFDDAIEISARPGHQIRFIEQVDGDKRVVRILAGPIARPAKRG